MFTAIDRLKTLSVSHVMARDVVVIAASQTMEGAAQQFAEHNISSAPVVDEQNRIVGILSAADFLERDCPQHEGPVAALSSQRHALLPEGPSGSLEMTDVGGDSVACYMTTAVQTIDAEASLLDAARVMCGAHLHHLPVIGPDARIVGVVSTMDVVAAVVNAVDELEKHQTRDF